MRESIGSTWIFMLVISFTLIFSGFLVLTLSYSKIYKMKNEMTSIIEKYNGLNDESAGIINDYLSNSNYRTKGKCSENGDIPVYGSNTLTSTEVIEDFDTDYYYCITYRVNRQNKTVYKITLFYDFNLPVFGQLTKFTINGETYGIKYVNNY